MTDLDVSPLAIDAMRRRFKGVLSEEEMAAHVRDMTLDERCDLMRGDLHQYSQPMLDETDAPLAVGEMPSGWGRAAKATMLLAAAGAGLLAAAPASADLIAPAAAHAGGMHGSEWRSDLSVYNSLAQPVTVAIQGTPRGQTASTADPVLTRVIAPQTVLFLEDVYRAIRGSTATGVDRLLLKFADAGGAPVQNLLTTLTMYNLAGPGQEFGMIEPVFDPTSGYHPTGTVLGTVLSKANFRNGILINTSGQGATIEWTYRNGAGGNETKVTRTYGPDMTFQHTSNVPELIGFEPEPSSILEAKIIAGSARVGITANNNTTNDPAWQDMLVLPGTISLDDQAILYVARWLPRNDSGFYLSNNEIRAMINGGQGTRSYAPELAAQLFNDPIMQTEFGNVGALEQWLRDRADGVAGNSEFCTSFDPFLWDNDAQGEPGVRTYGGVACGPVDFRPGATAMQGVYTLIKDEFLWRFVRNNPYSYGGQVGGPPDINFNPTWNAQDPN